MADERDPDLSRRYRELGSEEPPPALDQSILAAARRVAQRPHAPLVTPAGRHRWYFSLAAAAIVILAVAVTWHIERAQPDPETVVAKVEVPQPTEVAPLRKEEAPPPQPRPGFTPDPAPKIQQAPPEPAAQAESRIRENAAGEVARAETQTAPPAAAPSVRSDSREKSAAPQVSGRASSAAVEPPERWLERIVQLRKEGKQEEADKQLAEFRKRYPDYKVPEAALKPS